MRVSHCLFARRHLSAQGLGKIPRLGPTAGGTGQQRTRRCIPVHHARLPFQARSRRVRISRAFPDRIAAEDHRCVGAEDHRAPAGYLSSSRVGRLLGFFNTWTALIVLNTVLARGSHLRKRSRFPGISFSHLPCPTATASGSMRKGSPGSCAAMAAGSTDKGIGGGACRSESATSHIL